MLGKKYKLTTILSNLSVYVSVLGAEGTTLLPDSISTLWVKKAPQPLLSLHLAM